MKQLKPPYLSTALSREGKIVKGRIENIFLKKAKRGGAVIVAAALAFSLFIGCEKTPPSSPTEPTEMPTDEAVSLYEYKTEYIGNASETGSVIGAIIGETGKHTWNGMELQTDEEPYGLTLNYTGAPSFDIFTKRAPLFFALIDNLGYLRVNITDENGMITQVYTRSQADAAFDKPISEYAKTKEGFIELYALVNSLPKNLDEAVANAILLNSKGNYLEGECMGEGHIILGSEEKEDGTVEAYVIAQYSEYGFENGVFTPVSGSGGIPTLMVFDKNLQLLSYETAKDGAYYEPSVKEMFPPKYVSRAVSPTREDNELLEKMANSYAESYLKAIGRDAKILNYGEFSHPLLTDMGVSVEVSNKLMENRELSPYPFWVGSLEKLEDGVRYVYALDFKEGDETVRYTKSNYETGEVVESYEFDVKTAKAV